MIYFSTRATLLLEAKAELQETAEVLTPFSLDLKAGVALSNVFTWWGEGERGGKCFTWQMDWTHSPRFLKASLANWRACIGCPCQSGEARQNWLKGQSGVQHSTVLAPVHRWIGSQREIQLPTGENGSHAIEQERVGENIQAGRCTSDIPLVLNKLERLHQKFTNRTST